MFIFLLLYFSTGNIFITTTSTSIALLSPAEQMVLKTLKSAYFHDYDLNQRLFLSTSNQAVPSMLTVLF